jgi:hypothetical protein
MCKFCLEGKSQAHFRSRRQFLQGAAAIGLTTVGLNLFSARRAMAADPPRKPAAPARAMSFAAVL